MVSPLIEANSTSLGGWTSTLDGVDVAPGEVVSLRLADTSGVVFWDIEQVSEDDLTDLHGTSPALTIDLVNKTASFTAPVDPSDGWALTFKSTVGVMALGIDASGNRRTGSTTDPNVPSDFVTRFGVFSLAGSGLRVLAVDSELEASSRWGWTGIINAVIRGLGSIGTPGSPTGAAGGDLGGTYPNPSVLRIHGASVPIAGALVVGTVLTVTGVSALGYAALNLSNTATFTGTLPVNRGGTGQTDFTTGILHVVDGSPDVISSSLIVNADVSAAAAIAVSKLAAGTNGQFLSTVTGTPTWVSVTPSGIGGVPATRTLTGTFPVSVDGVHTAVDLSADRTLSLDAGGVANRVLLTTNGTTVTWGQIVNAQVDAAAAIAGTKISPNFGSQNVVTTGTLSAGATTLTALTISSFGAGVVQSSAGGVLSSGPVSITNVTGNLPVSQIAPGTVGQVLVTGAGPTATWATLGGDVTGTIPATVVARINGATVPAAGALTTGHVLQVSGVSALTYGFITDTNVSVTANIAVSKLATGTNGQVLTVVGTTPTWSTVTATTFGGVPSTRVVNGTAPIQINGGASATLAGDITVSILTATTGALGSIQLAGDLGGTGTSPSTLRLRGTTIGTAGGALTTGFVLRVTGASSADWQQLTLADTTGTLPIARLAPGTDGQVLTTVGTTPTWATIVNANIAAGAAIAVTKLAAGAEGTVLTIVGGVPTWSASAPVGTLPQSARQVFNVNELTDLIALSTTGFIGGELCVVRNRRRLFMFGLGESALAADTLTDPQAAIFHATDNGGNWNYLFG